MVKFARRRDSRHSGAAKGSSYNMLLASANDPSSIYSSILVNSYKTLSKDVGKRGKKKSAIVASGPIIKQQQLSYELKKNLFRADPMKDSNVLESFSLLLKE